MKLKQPENRSTVSLHTDLQKRFYAERDIVIRNLEYQPQWWNRKDNDYTGWSHPAPVSFAWEGSDGGCELHLSVSPDMSDEKVYSCDKASAEIYNLIPDTEYFWKVSDKNGESETYSFRTENELPRFIRMPNAKNVRDIGGYRCSGGKVRSGVLFRGSEISEDQFVLNDEGIEVFRSLGIKHEVDLQDDHLDKNGVPDFTSIVTKYGTEQHVYPFYAYGGIFCAETIKESGEIFRMVLDPSNYPLYFHCAVGTDRTGTVAFVLHTLLGVSDEDRRYDYMVSNLSGEYRNYTHEFTTLYKELNFFYPDLPFRDQLIKYFTDYIKIPKKMIDDFTEYMTVPDNG